MYNIYIYIYICILHLNISNNNPPLRIWKWSRLSLFFCRLPSRKRTVMDRRVTKVTMNNIILPVFCFYVVGPHRIEGDAAGRQCFKFRRFFHALILAFGVFSISAYFSHHFSSLEDDSLLPWIWVSVRHGRGKSNNTDSLISTLLLHNSTILHSLSNPLCLS